MNMIFKSALALACLAGFARGALQAQNFTDRKAKVYRVQPGATADITNKYGNVTCHVWEKDSVRITADVSVVSADPAKVAKIAAGVKINFANTGTTIIANTSFDDGKGSFFADMKQMAGSLLPNETRVTVNYTVYAPAYVHFRINNRFGDVVLDDFSGQTNLAIAYGNLKAGKLSGRSAIKITSGDADISSLADAVVDIGFCDFILGTGGRLTFSSYSSEIFADKVGFLKVQSKRDKYKIQELTELYGNGFFTHIVAYRLLGEAKYAQKFGSLALLEVSAAAAYLGITTEFADVETVFESGSAVNASISRTAESTLQFPPAHTTLDERRVGEKGDEIVTNASFGKAEHRIDLTIKATRKSSIRIFIK